MNRLVLVFIMLLANFLATIVDDNIAIHMKREECFASLVFLYEVGLEDESVIKWYTNCNLPWNQEGPKENTWIR